MYKPGGGKGYNEELLCVKPAWESWAKTYERISNLISVGRERNDMVSVGDGTRRGAVCEWECVWGCGVVAESE